MIKGLKLKKKGLLFTAVAAVAAVCTAVVITLALNGKPTLYIDGAEINIMPDGSAQLVTTVAIDNVPFSGGATFVLKYNKNYLAPSALADNKEIVTSGNNNDFCEPVDSLYGGMNPFWQEEDADGTTKIYAGYVNLNGTSVRLNLATRRSEERIEAGKVHVGGSPEDIEESYELYIDAADNGDEGKTELVQLSFQIKDKSLIPEIIAQFDGHKSALGVNAASNYLLQLDGRSVLLPYWTDAQAVKTARPTFYTSTENKVDTQVTWNFEDTLIDAVSAKEKVTINAYQAFTDGTAADIAAALVKYSPTVRGTYADGRMESITMPWGAGVGCTITTADGDEYLFRRTDTGYELYTKDANNEFTVLTTDESWYTPTGGVYIVKQYLTDDNGEVLYPLPIEVELTVTPIKVTGVTAKDLIKIYAEDDPNLPKTYPALELPGEAQLITDVVPGSVSLTMDIDRWTPDEATTGTDLSKLVADDSTPWPGKGTYPFAGPTYGAADIQREYPWLTVDDEYSLEAKRIVAGKDEMPAEFEIIAGVTDDSGLLTLQIVKKDDTGAYTDMVDDTTFRVKLPGGQIVDSTWFSGVSGAQYSVQKEKISTPTGDVDGYSILMQAGSPTSPTYQTERELVRRSINLGGVFSVAVTEPDKLESEFVTRYVAPRNNYYTKDYIADEFDFTGAKAGLFPFYRTSNLGTFVTLPIGYTVETTYDGNTGAEPGALGAFQVDNWTAVTPQDGSWNAATGWTPDTAGIPVKVTYGPDLFAARKNYPAFGEVKNPAQDLKQVKIKVEVQDEDVPEESLRLVYRGTKDSVTTTPNGEVAKVTFDTKQVGYIYRQTVVLTLINDGDTDIDGITIDCNDSNFIITDPPAAFLAAGAETTFTITYEFDLAAGLYRAVDPDPIRIYSANRLLKTFEAQFRVTEEPIRKVTIVVNDPSMGSAALVNGVTDTVPPELDDVRASSTYIKGEEVWVLAQPVGEFNIKRIYAVLNGVVTDLTEYVPTVTTDGDQLRYFEMPDHDVTVYVDFEESLMSKLRLEDLQDWSGKSDSELAHQLPLRVDDDDYTIVRQTTDYDGNSKLTADDHIQLSEETYFVVIPYEADRSQIKLTLRDVVASENIPVGIKIELDYGQNPNIYDYTEKAPPMLEHVSAKFDSPQPGKEIMATITISSGDVTREYKLRIIRRNDPNVEPVYPLQPGNSPYGMIMWDGNIADKNAAKAAFIDATGGTGDRFSQAQYTPAKAAGLDLTYWTEAWTGTWTDGVGYNYTNYDRVDEALFVFAGEAFDDYGPKPDSVTNTVGDAVPVGAITRSVEVVLLDTTKVDDKDAFGGDAGSPALERVTLPMGAATVIKISEDVWKDDQGAFYAVRPGVYRLKYTYIDFDGAEVSFYRPLIVLTRNGDVNADQETGDADVKGVQQRLRHPLGYEAGTYEDRALFRYRVCDANNDQNINNIDANTIMQRELLKQFYLPTDYR